MTENQIRLAMAALLTVVLMAAGLIILFEDSANADLQKAATGWIGIVIGYWLK